MLGYRKWSRTVQGLAYNDNLTVEDRSLTLPCPAWAADLEKLRRVVAGKLVQKTFTGVTIPTDLDALRLLEEKANAYLSTTSIRAWQKSLETVARHGGPLAFLTAIAWRRFRLGQRSTTIAADLGVTPCVVRRQAAGLAEIARRLYPDPELHLPRKHNSKTQTRPFRGGIRLRHAPVTQLGNSGELANGKYTHAGV